ncbi:MAG: hypothetical protein GXX87_01440 [Euryarchaeota archaeon]|jgi:hypothetical protein|nr:hypothetical protein [Euryarchaeota archaeon]
MIRLVLDGCKVDILPIVQGLADEAESVEKHYGDYEAYCITLGLDGVTALAHRDSIEDYEVSELDLVYATRLSAFGEVRFPCPAFCRLVDLCEQDGLKPIPLDMTDDEFTDLYTSTVGVTEFIKEHRLAKKGMKKRFDMSSPEVFVKGWDAYINKVRGYKRLAEAREKHIAEQILDLPRYRRSVMVVAEMERVEGIVKRIEGSA